MFWIFSLCLLGWEDDATCTKRILISGSTFSHEKSVISPAAKFNEQKSPQTSRTFSSDKPGAASTKLLSAMSSRADRSGPAGTSLAFLRLSIALYSSTSALLQNDGQRSCSLSLMSSIYVNGSHISENIVKAYASTHALLLTDLQIHHRGDKPLGSISRSFFRHQAVVCHVEKALLQTGAASERAMNQRGCQGRGSRMLTLG